MSCSSQRALLDTFREVFRHARPRQRCQRHRRFYSGQATQYGDSRATLKKIPEISYMNRHPVLAHFLQVTEQVAPLSLADGSWDNVGLLLESPTVRLSPSGTCRVLLTVDLTEAVYEEAIAQGAAIILSYHPPWFRGEKSLTLDQGRGVMRVVALCAAAGISIYSPHSALDALPEGINTHVGKVLGEEVGIASSVPITPLPTDGTNKHTNGLPSY